MATQITCTELAPGRPILPAALASPYTRVVHLVRHGQGTHNLHALQVSGPPCNCATNGPCVYRSRAHIDARLTPKGRLQASAAGACLARVPGAPAEVAYVSPLARTLETATVAVARCPGGARMRVVADERLRERFGVHWCDARGPKEEKVREFPTVDFAAIAPGPDRLHRENVREGNAEVATRAKSFFLGLLERPEKVVAVFAHSAFFRETMRGAFLTPEVDVARKFETGEVRHVLLSYS